ncbi:MAG: sulfatase-like hydrolase/transferase [Bacteroidota bacterium]|nr:sulfatase-like hydrolase/transferase [Bacteroidota bacterium]
MQKLKNAGRLVAFLLLLYSFLRILFYLSFFKTEKLAVTDILSVFYWGVRMDLAAIFYSNAVFFIFYFFLQQLFSKRWQKRAGMVLFLLCNLPMIAVNIIDLAYFKFNLRRSTIDLFAVMSGSMHALGTFWKAWWYLFLLFSLLCVFCVWYFERTHRTTTAPHSSYLRSSFFPGLIFIFATGILARGFSSRPLMPATPLLYLPAGYQPLVTNSTITVLYSILTRQTTLKEKNYFSASPPGIPFTAVQQLHSSDSFNKKNVVVFVLESFAREYMEKQDSLHAYTPFLDSLLGESIVCSNAYANGLESNKGIVAILAGIPPFFDEPFYYSRYASNSFRGIGNLLKEKGYSSQFFMGAPYDHFGFAKFSAMLGIEKYYSMDDYGNKKHFDGNWGIFDHYFLPYAASEIRKNKTPFLSILFSISTHFPYTLPDTLKAKFSIPGQAVEENSMSYLDYSLRLFFNAIKHESWYQNTIFVFTADHNIFWHDNERLVRYKAFRIPIFIHLPGARQATNIRHTVQQLDIIPSIFDLLHYDKPFMSFGKSVFDTISPHSAIVRLGDLYEAIDSPYIFGYNEPQEKAAYLYDLTKDPHLQQNLLGRGAWADSVARRSETQVKAILEYFNYSMIRNKLYVK